jgi:hypothetical protein
MAVATTQLVAAARVKAIPNSKTQGRLEDAAVGVREATRALVKAAKDGATRTTTERIEGEVGAMSGRQFKVVEMECQVRILELEKELEGERVRLAAIRKQGYMS